MDNSQPTNVTPVTPEASEMWSSDHTVFLGEYTNKIDDKGRLAVPAKFRPGLSGGAILTRGSDDILCIYTTEQWRPLADKLAALPPISSKEARTAQRTFLGGATAVTPDRQGRIILPANLREYAGLGSGTAEVVVVGLYNRVEIWPAARWKAQQKASDLDKIAPKLADLGI